MVACAILEFPPPEVSHGWRISPEFLARTLFAIVCQSGFDQLSAMKPVSGYFVIQPEDLPWWLSNMMKIPNADFLESTKSEALGARLWRLPPKSASTLHRHPQQEEFYLVLEGTGRIRIGEETITLKKYGGALVGPETLRQVFNDTDQEVLWLIVGAPEDELDPTRPDIRPLFYPRDPKELPPELKGAKWPPAP
jgi:mannose-6-phosphate isomerase-like protein (cupin superfamily)